MAHGNGSWRLGLWLTGALACGCAQTVNTTVAPVIKEGRDNELAAIAKYRDKQLTVHGTVASVGVRKVERLVAQHQQGYTVAAPRTTPYPFVILTDHQTPSVDHIICYFSPALVEEVSHVQQGAAMTVVGTFQEYAAIECGLELILKGCELP